MIELKGKYSEAKIMIDEVEPEAISMIQSIIDSPASEGQPVVIQADTHIGKGIVIGFCMTMGKMVKAEWVGCDIGCGLASGKFSGQTSMDLEKVEKRIRELVPTGFNVHETSQIKKFPFDDVQKEANIFVKKYNEKFDTDYIAPTFNDKWLTKKLKDVNMDEGRFFKSLGTMGGNNHFIEIGVDENNDYWATVHTGSRNFGLKIEKYWTDVAKGRTIKTPKEYDEEFKRITEYTVPKSNIPIKIKELKKKFNLGIDKEYLMGDNLFGYLMDMVFAQKYAEVNRSIILNDIGRAIDIKKFDDVISCTHNYINFKDLIIRKGAIASYSGKENRMIIPFNMADGVLICEGKDNKEFNYSAPHGSGRLFSRSAAKEKIDYDDYKRSMKDIYTTSVSKSTIDEAPASYKSSKMIEELIEPTVKIIHRVKPIMNIKDIGKGGQSWKEKKAEKKKKDLERKNQRAMKKGR